MANLKFWKKIIHWKRTENCCGLNKEKKEVKLTLFVFSLYYVIFTQVFWVKRQDVILFAIWFACDISESTSSCLLIDCCIKHKCHLIIFFFISPLSLSLVMKPWHSSIASMCLQFRKEKEKRPRQYYFYFINT